MWARLTFLALLIFNLAVAAWLLFGQALQPPFAATDPGVPELRLLSSTHLPAAAIHPAAEQGAGRERQCMTLGPLDTRARAGQIMQALQPKVPTIQFHTQQAQVSRGWWVYLPPMKRREQALEAARTLASKGVRDYYVISAGARENTISLGLFHDPDNARRRLAAITAMGFQPRLTQRIEQVRQYYVDFVIPAQPGFDWTRYVSDASILHAVRHRCP